MQAFFLRNGKLADRSAGRGHAEAALKAAGLGQPLTKSG